MESLKINHRKERELSDEKFKLLKKTSDIYYKCPCVVISQDSEKLVDCMQLA